jgi:Predicted transcriptional regulator
MPKNLKITIDEEKKLTEIGKALSSPVRLQILKLLHDNSYNIAEISEHLNIPASSAALHIRILENVDLVNIKIQPGLHGTMKLCSRKKDDLHILLARTRQDIDHVKSFSMPIGSYTDCSVTPTCGIVNEHRFISEDDTPSGFFLPERLSAQLLWSSSGYVEYKFPYPFTQPQSIKRLVLSFEICSEAPNFQENWKSDITIWINGVECGTWTSPGDFGSRRGRLNPDWWESGATQHGLLTTLEITPAKTYLNQRVVSAVSLTSLNLQNASNITIRIGNKEDAKNKRGFSLFGEKFGDFEQAILLSLVYNNFS